MFVTPIGGRFRLEYVNSSGVPRYTHHGGSVEQRPKLERQKVPHSRRIDRTAHHARGGEPWYAPFAFLAIKGCRSRCARDPFAKPHQRTNDPNTFLRRLS